MILSCGQDIPSTSWRLEPNLHRYIPLGHDEDFSLP